MKKVGGINKAFARVVLAGVLIYATVQLTVYMQALMPHHAAIIKPVLELSCIVLLMYLCLIPIYNEFNVEASNSKKTED